MVIALDDKWIWDSWYAHDGEIWHGFFLQADKSLGDPELRHWHVTQGHAVSSNLVDWRHLGRCFAPSNGPAWDDYTTWTGSVLQGPDGKWHLFYTGTNRAENGLKQRIGHATSSDLHNWVRVGDGQCLDLSGEFYEEYTPGHWHDRAMRDPWVMRDPQEDRWLMFFTARVPNVTEVNAAGAIGCATSPNLYDWMLREPVFVGGFGQLEVPQVFRHGGRWYCLFCTGAEHWSQDYAAGAAQEPVTGTHYLIGEEPLGPWKIAPGPFLDGSAKGRRYAGRILETEDGLELLGFLGRSEAGFVGMIDDPVQVNVDADGRLSLAQSEGV